MHPAIIKEIDPGKIETGIAKSVHSLAAPLWVEGQNVIFESGNVKKMKGTDKCFDTQMTGGTEVSGLLATIVAGTRTLYMGTKARLFKWTQVDLTATVIGTGYTGVDTESSTVPATRWSMVPWGNWLYATNNVDAPQVYKGVSAAAVGGGVPNPARIFQKLKVHLLAFTGTTLYFSDEDDPDVWNSGAAGNLPIRDLDSDVITAVPLGEQVAFYTENSMGLVSYLGAPFYFGAEKVLDGIGAVSLNAVCAVGRKHYGFSKSGFWVTDSVQSEYLDDPFYGQWIRDNLDTTKLSMVSVVNNELRKTVEISLPTLTLGRVTLSYNYKNGAWSFSTVQKVMMIPKGVFDYPIYGAADGYVFFSEIGNSFDGGAITANIISKPLDAGDDHLYKYISQALVHIKELVGTVNLYVGGNNFIDDAITWSSALPLDDGKEAIDLNLDEYKYFYVKIESTALTSVWAIAGFELRGIPTSEV